MKKILLMILIVVIFITAVILAPVYLHGKNFRMKILRPDRSAGAWNDKKGSLNKSTEIKKAYELLRTRKDNDAWAAFEKIINYDPDNPAALWGKAEILRRNNDYQQAESILNKILKRNPRHLSSLNTLAYIRYKQDMEGQALVLLNSVFESPSLDRENKALAYVLLGTINSSRSQKGGVINKLKYGSQIKKYFLKAKELSPDLPEVHLALGSFYLLAPKIIGGDLDKGIEELEIAEGIASDFVTVNARLAQGYKMKGLEDKYRFYLDKAKQVDSQNPVLEELE